MKASDLVRLHMPIDLKDLCRCLDLKIFEAIDFRRVSSPILVSIICAKTHTEFVQGIRSGL